MNGGGKGRKKGKMGERNFLLLAPVVFIKLILKKIEYEDGKI